MAPETDPRKRPRQARSRVTVDAIITATTQLLGERDLDSLTTSGVAARAGVSVGTLYQYFPNKEALVAAVIEAQLERDQDQLRAAFALAAEGSLAQVLDALSDGIAGFYAEEPLLYRHMVAALGEVERARRVEVLIEEIIVQFEAVLRDKADEHRHPDPERAAWMCVQTGVQLLRAGARERPDWLTDGSLLGELRAVMATYLGLTRP